MKVCYWCGDSVNGRVEWGTVNSASKDRVEFKDGGWCPIESCFLTKKQLMDSLTREQRTMTRKKSKPNHNVKVRCPVCDAHLLIMVVSQESHED